MFQGLCKYKNIFDRLRTSGERSQTRDNDCTCKLPLCL